MTGRLQQKLLRVALLTGGNPGERLCKTLSIDISSSTLIRMIHKEPLPEIVEPTAVCVDDWAYRKGIKYGTVVAL